MRNYIIFLERLVGLPIFVLKAKSDKDKQKDTSRKGGVINVTGLSYVYEVLAGYIKPPCKKQEDAS
jgi:hypothetical protein